jgi:hypothetical protein
MSERIELDAPDRNPHGWYVGVANETSRYLHRNGEVRKTTESEAGWTGYFATEAEAVAAIEKYAAKQAEVNQ